MSDDHSYPIQYFALVSTPGDLSTWWQVIQFDPNSIIWSRPGPYGFSGEWIHDQSLIEYTVGDATRESIEITPGQARALLDQEE